LRLQAEEKDEGRRVNRDKGENERKKGRTTKIVWKRRREERKRTGAESQKKRSREITLSPTRIRGSYESRGRRNPDYCSPDYNITRTDRSAYITGDQVEIYHYTHTHTHNPT